MNPIPCVVCGDGASLCRDGCWLCHSCSYLVDRDREANDVIRMGFVDTAKRAMLSRMYPSIARKLR